MSNIKKIIENPHTIYKRYHDFWSFLLESYEGGIDYTKGIITQSSSLTGLKNYVFKIIAGSRELQSTTSGNLFKHPKEREVDYTDRLRMSYYYNFCSPIVDIYTDHLFKQPIHEKFEEIETEVEERSENIDNKGSSIGEFRKEMADLAQLYGHIYVVTDTIKSDAEVITQQDIIDNGLFPYFTLHHPQNVINWALDEFGRPYWVVIREYIDGNKDPYNFDEQNLAFVQYRLLTRNEWVLYNGDYVQIATGVHGLNKVPITCIFDKQSKKARSFLGISSLADIVFIARDIYNSCSELKQILRDQTFAFLALQGNSKEYDELSVGTSKGLLYPPDRNPPQYISPPSSNAEAYFKHIDRQVTKIHQLAKLEGGSAEFSGQGVVEESGVAKAWDFNQTNSALSKKASNMEDGETKLWQIFAKWLGKSEWTGSIAYPNEFSIQSLNEDLDEAMKIAKLELGAEFDKEVKGAIIKKKFPRMDKEDLDKMVKDMESAEDKKGLGETGRLVSRIPSLQNKSQLPPQKQNANFGGNKGEQNAR